MGGNANTWVGAFSAAFLGIVTVAAIYQLNQGANVTNAATNISEATLGALFK